MFADDLETHGASIALVAAGGECVSYEELARRADAFAVRLGPKRKVLYLEARNEVEAIVAYLGALRARHPVMWVIHSQPAMLESRIIEAFQPDVIYHRDGDWRLQVNAAGPEPHPDLAVLLSTSGSTGSPKAVRLSRNSVQANAEQIAKYLELTAQDRAITSLPVGYSYGLSVLNSHLAVGASIVLTEKSVVDPSFWSLFRSTEATSMAGVPYTYELLERIGFRDDPPPTLRTLTQAGGRLSPDMVKTYAAWSRGRGVRFFAMYGQTEATARIAYLPPQVAEDYPDCIGQAIPGGELFLVGDGKVVDASGEPGELVYRGPNVMMGYALNRDDLARGAEVIELHTGDIAVRVDGRFFRVVGRTSRFSKIAGKRISLDDIQDLLKANGVASTVAGSDHLIAIWVETSTSAPGYVQDLVADRCGVPKRMICILSDGPVPRLPSGKADYRSILAQAEVLSATSRAEHGLSSPIASAFALAMGRATLDLNESFSSLGGDSLAYVQASIEVERQLGHLPEDWENLSIAELELMADPVRAAKPSAIAQLSTDILIRAIAIMAVVLGHIPQVMEAGVPVKGGALVLFMLAGYSLARFQRGILLAGEPHKIVKNFITSVIIPYYLLMLFMGALSTHFPLTIPSLLLFSNIVGEERGPFMPFWFPEAMLQCLILFGALFLFPPVRRLVVNRPWESGMAFVLGAIALKLSVPLVWQAPLIGELPRSPEAWMYGLTAGWAAWFAKSTMQKGVLLSIVTLFSIYDWGLLTSRQIYIAISLAALLLVSRVYLPRLLASGVAAIAAASFYIYLTHMLVFQVLKHELGVSNWFLMLSASIVSGIVGQRVWQWAMVRIASLADWAPWQRLKSALSPDRR